MKTLTTSRFIKCDKCGCQTFEKIYTVYVVRFNLNEKYEEENRTVAKDHLDCIRCVECKKLKEY